MMLRWKTSGVLRVSFIHTLDNSKQSLLQAIRDKRELKDDLKGQLSGALKEFKHRRFTPARV